jgi:two-component system, LytTR family, sensor kinase
MTAPVALMMRRMDRPALGGGVVLASILGFWLFYVGIVTLRARVMDFPAQAELAERRAIVTALGILVTIILWQIIRLFDNRTLLTRVIATVTTAIPCAVAIAAFNYYFFNVYDPAGLFDENMVREMRDNYDIAQEIAEFAISRYFFLIAWAALYLAMNYANQVRDSERRTALFAQAAQQAELRALRYQVNPHFLFNTLNSLSSLVMTDRKAEAEEMIMNLSAFFRTSLTGDPSADVTLREEVDLQKLYLDMETVRFPQRLSVAISVPDSLMDAAVPGLILQPLVENTVKHGVSRTTLPVAISITASADADRLVLTVADTGPGPTGPTGADHGIGLANVRDRLAARFGDEAKLTAESPKGGGFRVTLEMPLARHGN